VKQLSNREVADMKFHQGYSYFNLQQFDKGKPLLDEIRRNPKDPNYVDANYYFGFIALANRNIPMRWQGFAWRRMHRNTKKVVPFYIGTILYNTGQKDKALEYAESRLSKAGRCMIWNCGSWWATPILKRGITQKALPYLEDM